ncbi:BTAD domain-containing putative transcriptional regulator, partial [Streptomyces sp. NPDC059003]
MSGADGSGAVVFQVLGALGARDAHGRSLDLKGPRHRAVLARLLVARRRTVPVSWLVDDLWDDPPPTAVGTIRTFVGALRKALEPDRPRRAPARLLTTSGPGYALLAAPDAVDAWRFEAAVREAGRLLDAARPDPVPALLDDALALWQGPAYAEWAAADWARAEVGRLDGLRLLAVERRADAALALGRADEVVLDLEPHVDRHPWREDGWRLLALALYRGGRQGDALAVLRRARERLVGELGVDPGEGLRGVEGEILGWGVEGGGAGGAGGAGGVVRVGGAFAGRPRPAPSRSVNQRLRRGQGTSPPGTPVHRAARSSSTAGRAEFVGRAGMAGQGELVGRGAELGVLEGVADAVSRGGRLGLALVSGDAGAGKTALARELVARVAAAGWATAWGRAPEGGGVPAGWPWTEVLTELGCQEGESGAVGEDPAVARFRRHRHVAGQLTAVADRGRPLLLVLDDLHWAGEETLDLLAALVDGGVARPVLVVATYRDTEVPPELRDALGRLARSEPARVRLTGLTEDAVGRLLHAVADRPVDAATARAVHRRSGGNPFFVREIARLYAAEGPVALSRIPDGVRDIVRRRLASLPTEAATVLRQAAVIGPDADLDVLTALTGDEEAVLGAVECAVEAGFLAEPEPEPEPEAGDGSGAGRGGECVRFVHALVYETVYGDLSRSRRARLHVAVAETLERLRPDAVEAIAHHYLAAATRATAARAVTYAAEAARRAEAGGAPRRAAGWWEAALEAFERVGGETESDGGPGEPPGLTAAGRAVEGRAAADCATPGRAAAGHLGTGRTETGRTGAGQMVPGRAAPERAASGQTVPDRTVPGESAPGGPAPGLAVPGRAAAGHSETGRTEAGRTAPGQAVPGLAAAGLALPGRVAADQSETGLAVPGLAAPSRTGPGRMAPERALPERAAAGQTVPGRAGPDRAGPDRAGPDRAGPDRAG